MSTTKQRGSSVIYVAGSARELPAEVQDWLCRAENRAVASPHIYDMLAQLAQGKKFNAIIVNIQSVDWNEMDFFEHASRLSRGATIYVAGPYAQRAKVEAACRRGARLFDAIALTEAATTSAPESIQWTQPAAQASPLADSLAESRPIAAGHTLKLRVPSEDKSVVVEECNSRTEDTTTAVTEALAEELVPGVLTESPKLTGDSAEYPDEQLEAGNNPQSETQTESEADMESTETGTPVTAIAPEPSPSEAESQSESRSSFRLAPKEEEPAPRVMFPWSPYPDRPRRIPPRPIEPLAPPPVREVGAGPQTGSAASSLNVRLTAEEIAALMGRPHRSDQAREAP